MFVAALAHEHDYPVKWGTTVLDAKEFSTHLPAGFMLRWVWREREYLTPVKERVYCRHKNAGGEECGNFFGEKAPDTGAVAVHCCVLCNGMTCRVCATSFVDDGRVHVCDSDPEKNDDPFHGLQRGKDYQLCPGCGVHVTLRDGCNHIVCTQSGCGASFCYICGETIARWERDHFKPGMPCPKYNQPGSRHAHHGEPVAIGHIRDHDTPVLRALDALTVIAALSTTARIATATSPDDAGGHALRRLSRKLRMVTGMQTFGVPPEADIDALQHGRTRYLAAYAAVDQILATGLTAQWADFPGLPWVLASRPERHEPFLATLNARISTLDSRN